MKTGVLLAGLAAAVLAGPAFAQAPPDPIGDLLAKQAKFDEPDEASQPPPPANRTVRGGVTKELSDAAYDARIRASMASAMSFRGPLEGGWTIAAADGDLYALQLSDRGRGVIEGAWRDLRRTGAVDASGFIDEIQVAGAELLVRFADGRVTAALHSGPGLPWTGELNEGGQRKAISLKRTGP